MSNPYAHYGVDKTLATDGIWYTDVDSSEYLLAHASVDDNPKFAACYEQRCQPYRRQIDSGTLPQKKLLMIFLEAFCDTILLDWKVNDKNGKPLKFSRDNAKRLLTDLPRLYNTLLTVASDITRYKVNAEKDELGNSSATSSTKSTTRRKVKSKRA